MISLIIPCFWATDELVETTKKCLDSLKYGQPDEVIVVDDGSPIKTDLATITLKENQGYTVAVNTGLNKAKGEIIIVGNNDLVFTPGWLDAILLPLERGYDIASIGISDQGYETEDRITEGDKFGSLWAMKRKVYKKLGGLDEDLGRGYFTDLDYQRRAEEAGFRIGKNRNHLVEHEGKGTFKIIDPDDKGYRESMKKYYLKWGEIH